MIDPRKNPVALESFYSPAIRLAVSSPSAISLAIVYH